MAVKEPPSNMVSVLIPDMLRAWHPSFEGIQLVCWTRRTLAGETLCLYPDSDSTGRLTVPQADGQEVCLADSGTGIVDLLVAADEYASNEGGGWLNLLKGTGLSSLKLANGNVIFRYVQRVPASSVEYRRF